MSGAGGFASRLRESLASVGRLVGRAFRRTVRDVTVTIEDRPDVGPFELELPYPLPTREDGLAFFLFYFAGLALVVSVTLVVSSYALTGEVPPGLVNAIGGTAVLLAVFGNMGLVARHLQGNATSLLKPLVGAGIPLLDALHFWFNPVVAGMGLIYVLLHPSNNWLMPVAALALLVWTVTGLLLKLPRGSPWNGPMLKRWAGTLHRRPFVYLALIAIVSVSYLADLLH